MSGTSPEGEDVGDLLVLSEPLLRLEILVPPGRRYTIARGLQVVPAEEYVFTLRRQEVPFGRSEAGYVDPLARPPVGTIWSHTYRIADGSVSAGTVESEVGTTMLGAVRAIYGLLPAGAIGARVVVAGSVRVPVEVRLGAYLTSAPIGEVVTVIFLDERSEEVGRVSRGSAHYRGLSLPHPNDVPDDPSLDC